MKKFFLLYILLSSAKAAVADHITGGEIYYTLTGSSSGQYTYNITLKLFMICNTAREFNNPTYISFFDRGTNARIKDVSVILSSTQVISEQAGGPCMTNPPLICYRAGYYNFSVTLPASQNGYVLSSSVVYRVDDMRNLVAGYNQIGATYTAEIPGNTGIANAPANNSARFTGDDLVVMCANNSFSYSFAAKDDDGDKLRYTFCNAYRESAGGGFGGERSNPPSPPPYSSVPYGQGYSGGSPLGPNVSINPNTGVITGLAPAAGTYVIAVCVDEIRNNVVIATQRKDLQVTITSCTIAAATLLPEYRLCADTKTISLANLSTSPLINTWNWQFINNEGNTVFTTTQQQPDFTFTDTGVYHVKLVINKGDECADSTSSSIRVYPGFKAGFRFNGLCMNKPTQFTDTSSSVYGLINYWDWDFDDNTVTDVSQLQNPSYTYTSNSLKNVRLIVADTKGCMDTVFNTVNIMDKPPVNLLFKDTLICKSDSVQLSANTGGALTWSPVVFMNNNNTQSPVVAPPATTVYYVDLNDNGCLNRDSVIVNVTDHVELNVMADTTICSGDVISLNIVSDALKYTWSPAASLNNAFEKTPAATPPGTTSYEVIAAIGSCTAKDNILVSTVDYPVAAAGNDTMICFNTSATLHGFTDGSSFAWSPQTGLQNPASLTTAAYPGKTASYILTAYDTKGCPKPGVDTVTVTVLPILKAYAGKDTAVVINQPLQLNATGGVRYEWQPPASLSNAGISNPVALYTMPDEGIRYTVFVYNEAGCVDTASLTVKVFATSPTVFVPTGFTPNGDGRNDILKPIAAGMQRVELFNVYNRWGQLVFRTSVNGKGWDGTVNGKQQGAGTFVWMVKAVDYTGKPYMKKGTVVLIR